jgi:hypothetical protein
VDVTGVFPSLGNVAVVPEDRTVVKARGAIGILVLHDGVVRQSSDALHLGAFELRDFTHERHRGFIRHVRDIVPRRNDLVILLPGNFFATILTFVFGVTGVFEMFLEILALIILVEDHLVVNAFTFSKS